MSVAEEIKKVYPSLIASMDKRFNSHEFIIKLARQHQGLYIKFLYQYAENETPFKVAHGQLAKFIGESDKVKALDYESSTNIFGETSDAMVWSKK